MASSSSSSVPQKCQVFLSFRGKDTRNNFTSHLHAALKGKGIDTFVDYRLERGEGISQALSTAIEKSKISIIVLSKNYASSSWCLDELSKILECKKRYGQEVVPIFYHVDPSDVRYQKGSFEEAFAKHQQRFKDEGLERWRAALKEVANLSGYHIQPHLPESTPIAEIVKDISKKLIRKSSYYTKHLVGMDSHIKKIESLLCIDSVDDVRIIGISGMGGIGKTTIAEAVYTRFFAKFEGCCFVNVKEKLKHGQVHLREELFSKILEDGDLNLDTSLLSASIIARLHSKKIFIILDDVNNSMQLLDLLPKKDSFGPGSRIIVTSRDKQVFQRVVDKTYEVKGMVDDNALQLFSMCAFNQDHPGEDFVELSEKVIHFAKGVPLALSVVGCALNGKSKYEWEGHLIKLKESSDPVIDEVLKISYDGLEDDMKGIFLDIACFYRGERMDYVENILDGSYTSVMAKISFLIDKSLITISCNMLEIHDLLQLMAWNIIRQESKEPGKRSRLWASKDICHVLKNNTGTKSVEGMVLDMSKIAKLSLSPKAFKKMCNLRLLKLYYTDSQRESKVYLSQQGLEYLPYNLIYLYWDDYPSKSLPSNFCPENLVKLIMHSSQVEQLWNGVQDLVKLKNFDLSGTQHLIKIPDLSRATNLESMNLDGCRSLVEVTSSIRCLNKLSYLNLMRCQNLGNFSSNIDLRSLRYLFLNDCSNITKFPEISENLWILSLSGTAIKEVPSSINRLSRLKYLELVDCRRLERLPSNICKLKFLEDLNLNGCLKLESFPEILETMKCLKSLYLGLTSIEELPSSIENLVGLELLVLDHCENLKTLPSSFWELKSLEKVSLINCSNFTKLPKMPGNLIKLYLSGTTIEQVPSLIERVSKIWDINLEICTTLRSLPRNIIKSKSLRISGFSNVEVIQELLGTVEELFIYPSSETASLAVNLMSLEYLQLRGCNLFPSYFTCISSLTFLDLSRNNFETIPACIKQLLELKCLDLSYCKRLRSLPELPPNLQVLNAHSCSSLEAVSSLFTFGRGRHIKYSFTNCLKLDQNAISHILAKTMLWIHHRATEALKLYRQGSAIVNHVSLTICLPGSEIPEWFSSQNTGSFVTTQLPLYGDDCKFVYVALCAVVEFNDYDENWMGSVECKYKFRTNNDSHHAGVCWLTSRKISVGSDNMFLGSIRIDYGWFSEASLQFYVPGYCKVKKCGVHLLYPQNDPSIYEDYGTNFCPVSLPYNARVFHQPSKRGSGSGSSDLPSAKDEEESNSIINRGFGEAMQEDGTIIKRFHDDHHNDETEPNGNFSSDQVEEKPHTRRLKFNKFFCLGWNSAY